MNKVKIFSLYTSSFEGMGRGFDDCESEINKWIEEENPQIIETSQTLNCLVIRYLEAK